MLQQNQTRLFEGETPLPGESETAGFDAFNNKMMSPSLDLNQMDIHSLDGSPSAEKAREEIDDILK